MSNPQLSIEPPRYARVTHLLPQDTAADELLAVLAIAQPRRQTVSFSADHALDTHQPDHTLHVWGVERIVWPPAADEAAARAAFEAFCRQQYGRVPHILWERFPGEAPPLPPQTPRTPRIGLHDIGGGDWLRANRLTGFCVHAAALRTQPATFDFTHLAEAGIDVIVRLNYGFTPLGTIPGAWDAAEVARFIDACRQTIAAGRGVWGWVIGNEPGNPAERPGGTANTPEPTPAHYAAIYNAIYAARPTGTRLSPAAVDPYYGLHNSDPYRWQREMLAAIAGAEFITLHVKSQGSLPSQVSSEERFAQAPLAGRHLHVRAYRGLIAELPQRYATLPIVLTEINPQRFGAGHPADAPGWEPQHSAAWIDAAYAEIAAWNRRGGAQIDGVVFYRWDFDHWALLHRPQALTALVTLPGAVLAVAPPHPSG